MYLCEVGTAPRQSLARTMLALMLISLPSISMAEDAVKLSPDQVTSLGVRVIHPVASPTDKTLPYPAQIVIPTPQLWVVSSPVRAGDHDPRGSNGQWVPGRCREPDAPRAGSRTNGRFLGGR